MGRFCKVPNCTLGLEREGRTESFSTTDKVGNTMSMISLLSTSEAVRKPSLKAFFNRPFLIDRETNDNIN